MITHFYEMYFPEGIHKVNSHDLILIKQLLEDSSLDNVLIPVFVNIIHQENMNPTFKHLENWPQLSDL